MYVPDKQYNPNASEINDMTERQKHEEEMEQVLVRMENASRRKKKSLCWTKLKKVLKINCMMCLLNIIQKQLW